MRKPLRLALKLAFCSYIVGSLMCILRSTYDRLCLPSDMHRSGIFGGCSRRRSKPVIFRRFRARILCH
ncbi:hypothetical protein I7I48_01408 [Histoplasma ohiense]|nr:hypothetical protein I7I48_01408 [Histoplasma ohiense (nom. inval.)]